jgi:hypothetical protein
VDIEMDLTTLLSTGSVSQNMDKNRKSSKWSQIIWKGVFDNLRKKTNF